MSRLRAAFSCILIPAYLAGISICWYKKYSSLIIMNKRQSLLRTREHGI